MKGFCCFLVEKWNWFCVFIFSVIWFWQVWLKIISRAWWFKYTFATCSKAIRSLHKYICTARNYCFYRAFLIIRHWGLHTNFVQYGSLPCRIVNLGIWIKVQITSAKWTGIKDIVNGKKILWTNIAADSLAAITAMFIMVFVLRGA